MKKKKKNNILQFPNIFRIITESVFLKNIKLSKTLNYVILGSVCMTALILAVFISIFAFKIFKETTILMALNNERAKINEKFNFWQSVAEKYEGYKDAYFQMAILKYKLKEYKLAKEYSQRALLLDPGFEDAKKLDLLLKKY